jgi:hypothetical protein
MIVLEYIARDIFARFATAAPATPPQSSSP